MPELLKYKRPVNVYDTIYRPLCYWVFVWGLDDWNGFGLFDLICLVVFDGDRVEMLYW